MKPDIKAISQKYTIRHDQKKFHIQYKISQPCQIKAQEKYILTDKELYTANMEYYMTYLQSSDGITISRKRALKELESHGITSQSEINEFYSELGYRETYEAYEVLVWLGH